MNAVFNQVIGQFSQRRLVQLILFGERGDHCRDDSVGLQHSFYSPKLIGVRMDL
jgi:hypothetical protein